MSLPSHWTLWEMIDSTKYHYLLNLPHQLNASNYVSWNVVMMVNLKAVGLYEYCSGELRRPLDSVGASRWDRADALVRAILITNMSEKVIAEVGMCEPARRIWEETQRYMMW
ncbi:hypothetical protein AX17_004707 [Amanita inopinata Kibby_2008]|nr:hypothetical protein AX17_004707 [Amanita inopinata Kibby_2008]